MRLSHYTRGFGRLSWLSADSFRAVLLFDSSHVSIGIVHKTADILSLVDLYVVKYKMSSSSNILSSDIFLDACVRLSAKVEASEYHLGSSMLIAMPSSTLELATSSIHQHHIESRELTGVEVENYNKKLVFLGRQGFFENKVYDHLTTEFELEEVYSYPSIYVLDGEATLEPLGRSYTTMDILGASHIWPSATHSLLDDVLSCFSFTKASVVPRYRLLPHSSLGDNYILIDLDGIRTDITMFHFGTPVVTRHFALGGDDFDVGLWGMGLRSAISSMASVGSMSGRFYITGSGVDSDAVYADISAAMSTAHRYFTFQHLVSYRRLVAEDCKQVRNLSGQSISFGDFLLLSLAKQK